MKTATQHGRFWIFVSFIVTMISNAAVFVLMSLATRRLPSPLNDSALLNGSRLFLGVVLLGFAYLLLRAFNPDPIFKTRSGFWRFLVVGLLAGTFGIALAQGLAFYAMASGKIGPGNLLLMEAVVPGVVFVFLKTDVSYALSDFFLWLLAAIFFGLLLQLQGVQISEFGIDRPSQLLLGSVICTTAGLLLKAKGFPPFRSQSVVVTYSFLRALWPTSCAAISTAVWLCIQKPEVIHSLAAVSEWNDFAKYVGALALSGTCLGWLALLHLLRFDPMLACLSLLLSPLFGWAGEWVIAHEPLVFEILSTIHWKAAAAGLTVVILTAYIAFLRFHRLQRLRIAEWGDLGAIEKLIDLSINQLLFRHYSKEILKISADNFFRPEDQLIRDRTYFVMEYAGEIVGCGGWSQWTEPELRGDRLTMGKLDPAVDAARIRAFFVRPDRLRRGIASEILEKSEADAKKAGFSKAYMLSTIGSESFYAAKGYTREGSYDVPLPNDLILPVVRMTKEL